jgi:NACalpha-BTF3-like transcription factor
MSKMPPFVCATSVTNTVDLLSDSSDDEYLWGTPSFVPCPSGDDEDEVDDDNKDDNHEDNEDEEDDEDDDNVEDDVQVVMVKEPVSRAKTMPQPFCSFHQNKRPDSRKAIKE